MAFIVVTRSDDLRGVVEDEIQRLYWQRYSARISSLPDTLLAEVGLSGAIDCAAGIRFGGQGLFSECYLRLPLEQTLGRTFGSTVRRERVVEICNLVALRPGRSLPFIRSLIEFAEMADAEWAIFTATRALRALLHRGGLAMVDLARAERTHVGNPGDWGSYYEHDPWVMAVSRDMALGHKPADCLRASRSCAVDA